MAGTVPFSRKTIVGAAWAIHPETHSEFNQLMLLWGLEGIAGRGPYLNDRTVDLATFAMKNPDVTTEEGVPIYQALVELAVSKCFRFVDGSPYGEPSEWVSTGRGEEFLHCLERDGYVVHDGKLRRSLPKTINLPAADDEVHLLLDQLGLGTCKVHLDEAIDNHARGQWPAANAQLRTFIQALFDDLATVIDPAASSKTAGEARRQHLANLDPPFLMRDFGEWSDDGKNFVNGVFKRLHSHGSHPGLSDEEDCTFRLHLALIAARLFLRRAASRTGVPPF